MKEEKRAANMDAKVLRFNSGEVGDFSLSKDAGVSTKCNMTKPQKCISKDEENGFYCFWKLIVKMNFNNNNINQ